MNKIIFQKISESIQNNDAIWLATVIHAEGSSPGRIGMKMLVTLEGELSGTIGGGTIEQVVVNRIRKEKPTTIEKWSYDLDGQTTGEKTGMICGGAQEILVDPLFNSHHLYIIGGGHCGQALSELAARSGFNVTVIDDRPECANRNQHPFATRIICAPYTEVEQQIKFSPEAYIVIMTHGHKQDTLVLKQIVGKAYKYLGVIGSKKKSLALFNQLIKNGADKEELKKIYSPIGLPIGSQTPMEVSISIMAQLIAVRKNITEITFNSNQL